MAVRITINEFAPISQRGGFDLIDVRTPDEFYELHAVGALLMPLDGLNPQAIMESRGERAQEPLYIICRSGNRSIVACGLFEKAGYTNVISIDGGTQAWQSAGLPLNRGIRRPISIDRQIRLVAGLSTLAGSLAAIWQPWLLLLPGLTGAAMAWAAWKNSRFLVRLFAKLPWNAAHAGRLPAGCGGCSTSSCHE